MTIKYTSICHSTALQNFPKLEFLFWKQTIWQPCIAVAKKNCEKVMNDVPTYLCSIIHHFIHVAIANPGVDVMLIIFGDFCQFSAKKLAFFSKTPMLWSQFCILLLCFESKTPFFRIFFGGNILKTIIGTKIVLTPSHPTNCGRLKGRVKVRIPARY
jgi:hypothetical protein